MGSAVLNPSPHQPPPPEPTPAPESAEALRRQAAARIAALRQRRQQPSAKPTGSASTQTPATTADTKSRIAAAVAERYAQAQTYRQFLAAESERAVQQARAAAEIAARNAKAIADAQQQLLDSLAAEAKAQRDAEAAAATTPDLWPDLAPEPTTHAKIRVPRPREASIEDCHPGPELREGQGHAFLPAAPPIPAPTVRVAFYEDIPPLSTPKQTARPAPRFDPYDPEAYLLDEEISFRQSPVFEEPAGPPTALPANLLQFPRQLIASRKARPRYAEGPLADTTPTDDGSQLRIFEVDPTQIATAPDLASMTEAQWTSIWLDTPTARHALPSYSEDCHRDPERAQGEAPAFVSANPAEQSLPLAAAAPQLHPARWNRRALAASIDLGITGAATLVFTTAFAAIAGHAATSAWDTHSLLTGAAASLHGLPLAVGLGALTGTAVALSLAYQALFFTFSDATPGMRVARIGLCTFSDENPTRAALRRRVPAFALSTLLFGIGLLWALLDEDGLPWHDLICRMYQRSY